MIIDSLALVTLSPIWYATQNKTITSSISQAKIYTLTDIHAYGEKKIME